MGNLDLHQKVGTSKIDQMKEWRKSEQRAPQKLLEYVKSNRPNAPVAKQILVRDLVVWFYPLLIENQTLQIISTQLIKYSNIWTQFSKKKRKTLRILCDGYIAVINVHRIPDLFVSDITPVESTECKKISPYWLRNWDIQTFWSIPMTIIGM